MACANTVAATLRLGACDGKSIEKLGNKSHRVAISGVVPADATPAAAAPRPYTVQTVTEAGNHGALVKALTAAGLAETLEGTGSFTVLAPAYECCLKIPPGKKNAFLTN